MRERLPQAGFDAVQHLHFPQPCYPSGWWSATMARRDGTFEGFRARDAAALDTRFFHAGIYDAARVLPRYLAEALT